MEPERQRLRDLSRELFRLHGLLLARERRTYESQHGQVGAHELLRLLLHDGHFAWLRSLSRLMAEIDEIADAEEPVATAAVERLLRETHWLLKSDHRGVFQDRYRDALQDSPDVVMAHAGVSALLRR